MRHNVKKGLKLGTDASHTKAMKKSLAKALFENDRIKTTETRAKALRSFAEPIITWAKKGDLHSRRLAIAKLGDSKTTRVQVALLGPRDDRLSERAQGLGAGLGGLDAIVLEESLSEALLHGLGVAGVGAELKAFLDVVTHCLVSPLKTGHYALRLRPIDSSLSLTSSIDLTPKLRMLSRSFSENSTS